MAKSWTQTVLALIVVGIGLLFAGILGMFAYMSATATPLHPDPQNVPSAAHSAPSRTWADAVARGQQIVRAALIDQNLPGISVAVGVDGDLVWAEGFGWATLESHVPVTPRTRFRIGTASTALTSSAVGLLVERKQLDLDAEIQTYVPAFPKKQWPVTLRQLMGHVAGVRSDAGDEEPVWIRCEETLDALQRFSQARLRFEPGTRYHYSSYGWILVSAAVEAAADEPLFTFMRKEIFEPLGMIDTRIDSAATEAISNVATFYFPKFAGDPRYGPQPPSDVDYSCFSGSSAFLTTPSDLVRFGSAINSGKLLQPATVQLFQTPLRLPSGEDTGYGLGWDLETASIGGEQTRVVGHDGTMRGGPVSSFIIVRERGIVVAVTSNTAYADTFAVAVAVAQPFAEAARSPARK